MRWGLVRGRRISQRIFCGGNPICQPRHLTLQRFNQFPLRGDGLIQVFNGLILMGDTDFKFV